MNKRFSKFLISIILVLTLSFTVVGCQKDGGDGTLQEFQPVKYEGTHILDRTETDDYLIKDGVTDYVILIPSNASSTLGVARDELMLFVERATGVQLEVVKDTDLVPDQDGTYTSYVQTGKYISLGNTKLLDAAGLTLTSEECLELDIEGLRMETVNKSIYMFGYTDYAVVNAVYTFLEFHFNFDFFFRNCWYIDTNVSSLKLYDYSVKDIPDIERRSSNVAWYGVTHDAYKTVDALVEGIIPQDIKNRRYRGRYTGGHQEDLLAVITDRSSNSVSGGYIHNCMEFIAGERSTDYDNLPHDYERYFYQEYQPDGCRIPESWPEGVPFRSENFAAQGWTRLTTDNPDYTDDNCNSSDWNSNGGSQLCYEGRGNSVSFEALAKRCTEIIQYSLIQFPREQYPLKNTMTLTMEDVGGICSCQACSEARQNEGKSPCGGAIRLLNRIDEYLDAWMAKPENEPYKRDNFHVVIFAYSTMAQAPAVYSEAEQKWVPANDSCKARDGVGIYYADNVYFNYVSPFYDQVNNSGRDNFEAWASVTDFFWLWTYGSDNHATVYPNDKDSFFGSDAYQYFADMNVTYTFNESQDTGSTATQFQNLSSYIQSKLQWDSSRDIRPYVDKWFKNMFGPGADAMYQFYMMQRLHCQSVVCENDLRTTHFSTKSQYKQTVKFWPLALLEGWVGLVDQALEAIEVYKTTDYNKYLVYKDHIDVESITPMYIILKLYADAQSGTKQLSIDKYMYYRDRLKAILLNYADLPVACSGELMLGFVNTL